MNINTFATEITVEDLPTIIAEAAKYGLNVESDLDGILDDQTLTGEHFAILSFDLETHTNATFTTMWYKDFYRTWKFTDIRMGIFHEVSRITN